MKKAGRDEFAKKNASCLEWVADGATAAIVS